MTLASKNIVESFSKIAHTYPNQVAIELNEQTWTYAELLMNVICIAHHLKIERGGIVYQYVDRSFEMVCGLLGIMCVGGIYCPLDPNDPPTYVRALIEETQGQFVLVHQNTRNRFSSTISEEIQMIDLGHILFVVRCIYLTDLYVQSDNPSFIISDRHKPILHTHRSLLEGVDNLITWDTEYGDKILQLVSSSLSSYIHLFEILMPMMIIPAGTLVLLPLADTLLNMDDFCEIIQEKQITNLMINPSLLKTLLDWIELNHSEHHQIFEQLCILWISGECSQAHDLAKIKSISSKVRIFLILGVSETGVVIGREIKESIEELRDFQRKMPEIENPHHISNDDDTYKNETDRFLNGDNFSSENSNKFPFPGFLEKTFYCLRQRTLPRYQCLKLLTWPWFEHVSMFVILLNCITLGIYQPCVHVTDIKCTTTICIGLQTMEYFILAFFTIEMLIKMIAMGIVGQGTYLADPWNKFDCFVVITG